MSIRRSTSLGPAWRNFSIIHTCFGQQMLVVCPIYSFTGFVAECRIQGRGWGGIQGRFYMAVSAIPPPAAIWTLAVPTELQ
jgi:hypothetical protein